MNSSSEETVAVVSNSLDRMVPLLLSQLHLAETDRYLHHPSPKGRLSSSSPTRTLTFPKGLDPTDPTDLCPHLQLGRDPVFHHAVL